MEFRFPFDPATGLPGDGSVGWTNGDPGTGTEGSIPPAEALNDPQREICHVIDFYLGDGSFGSGQAAGDLTQLRQAIQAALTAVGGFLPLAGGTVTGALTVNGTTNMTGAVTVTNNNPGFILSESDTGDFFRVNLLGGVPRLQVPASQFLLLEGGSGTDPAGGIRVETATGTHDFIHEDNLSLTDRRLIVRDEKASGTDGGTATAGTYVARNLNTIAENTITGASLSSNQVTLLAGKYGARASAPARVTAGSHRIRLRNITAGATLVLGTSETNGQSASEQTRSHLVGTFTLGATSVLELQHHRSSLNGGATHLGFPSSISGENEVYSQLEIWRIN